MPVTVETAPPREPQLDVAARTDIGRKRLINEDAVLATDPCFLVADGMGGHEFGDRASKAAVAAFSEVFTRPGAASLLEIERALAQARGAVHEIAAESSRGAGCTLTGVIRTEYEGEPYWYVLNVGDSRVYLLREGELTQLTKDHSLRAELMAASAPEADLAPRNVITRALGSDHDEPDAWLLPIETGSRLLVCSDGLSNEVADAELRAALMQTGTSNEIARGLLLQAMTNGGRDNITLIVIDVLSGGAENLPTRVIEPVDGDDDLDDTLERTQPRPVL